MWCYEADFRYSQTGKYDVTDMGYRNLLGYLPQDFGYYPDFTGMESLLYVAALKGLMELDEYGSLYY